MLIQVFKDRRSGPQCFDSEAARATFLQKEQPNQRFNRIIFYCRHIYGLYEYLSRRLLDFVIIFRSTLLLPFFDELSENSIMSTSPFICGVKGRPIIAF